MPDTPEPLPSRSTPVLGVVALVMSLLAVAAVLGFAWHNRDHMAALETQLARRISDFDAASREARRAAKAANDVLADLNTRLKTLENRAQETQDQQLALSTMYQELARSQDERVIADIEQTLLLAQQQLQLAGNVRAALIGLEAAETRLAHLHKPQLDTLRTAIVTDIERLKLMPAADTEGLNARLEGLFQSVDKLQPESEAEMAAPTKSPLPVQSETTDTLTRLTREAWAEFKSLVRIRRLDHPDLPLLAPSQAYFLRENLKMRLLAARLALLQRDENSFRADLAAALDWTRHYFNRADPAAKAFATSLEELQRAPVALKDARIDASLQALRALRKGS